MSSEVLSSLGERKIIDQLLRPRYSPHSEMYGNDSAVLHHEGNDFIVTSIDPAPRPVAWTLGYNDYYYWGWLLSAINLSDIAASGAKPTGLMTSLTLPSTMLLADFDRLLSGVDDCAKEHEVFVIGGNLRESEDGSVRCEAVAYGRSNGTPLSRRGAKPGDLLVAVGPTGKFWASILAHQLKIDLDELASRSIQEVLLTPRPQVWMGRMLRGKSLVSSCTDASDGIFAAVQSLTTENGLGALLTPNDWNLAPVVNQVADIAGILPARLALGFGDLQLVVAFDESKLSGISDLVTEVGAEMLVLGRVTKGRRIMAPTPAGDRPMNNFDNERFTSTSQFTAGLAAYQRRLLETALTSEE